MTKYLAVEDLGARTMAFHKACEVLKERGVEVALDHEHRVDFLIDRGCYSVEDLASYDGFFVDFDLSSKVKFSDDSLDFAMNIGDERLKVHATTGMGVLLYLSKVIKTDRYKAARTALAEDRSRRVGMPRFYTFVELDNFQSKFYAAAAQSWFGADFFLAFPDSHILADILEDLPAWRGSEGPELVRTAVWPFDLLMDCKLASTHYDWGYIPEAYDWLRYYLQARGKSGSQAEFSYIVARELNIQIPPGNATNQYARYLDPVQTAMNAFVKVYEEESTKDWDAFAVSKREDPMYEVLLESHLFWEEPDVRQALRAHRAQLRLPRGSV